MPMIAWFPGKIKAGSITDHASAFWDVMPTLAELTDTKAADNINGISFLPTLLGKKNQKKHDYLYWEFHEQGGKIAVMKGDWKAIWLNVTSRQPTIVELYDLSKDIGETNNVAAQYPEIIAELHQLIKQARVDSEIFPFSLPEMNEQ